MTFFTSDQHFGHFNIIRLSHRPFSSVEEMDGPLLSRWNAKVRDDDTVYILGPCESLCALLCREMKGAAMKNQPIKAYIFDMDGTLVETREREC